MTRAPIHLTPKTVLECSSCGAREPGPCPGCGEGLRGSEPVLCFGGAHIHARCKSKAIRRHTFQRKDDGAYVLVFQRFGEPPQLDLAFFDGNREVADAALRMDLLADAWRLARAWEAQGTQWA